MEFSIKFLRGQRKPEWDVWEWPTSHFLKPCLRMLRIMGSWLHRPQLLVSFNHNKAITCEALGHFVVHAWTYYNQTPDTCYCPACSIVSSIICQNRSYIMLGIFVQIGLVQGLQGLVRIFKKKNLKSKNAKENW